MMPRLDWDWRTLAPWDTRQQPAWAQAAVVAIVAVITLVILQRVMLRALRYLLFRRLGVSVGGLGFLALRHVVVKERSGGNEMRLRLSVDKLALRLNLFSAGHGQAWRPLSISVVRPRVYVYVDEPAPEAAPASACQSSKLSRLWHAADSKPAAAARTRSLPKKLLLALFITRVFMRFIDLHVLGLRVVAYGPRGNVTGTLAIRDLNGSVAVRSAHASGDGDRRSLSAVGTLHARGWTVSVALGRDGAPRDAATVDTCEVRIASEIARMFSLRALRAPSWTCRVRRVRVHAAPLAMLAAGLSAGKPPAAPAARPPAEAAAEALEVLAVLAGMDFVPRLLLEVVDASVAAPLVRGGPEVATALGLFTVRAHAAEHAAAPSFLVKCGIVDLRTRAAAAAGGEELARVSQVIASATVGLLGTADSRSVAVQASVAVSAPVADLCLRSLVALLPFAEPASAVVPWAPAAQRPSAGLDAGELYALAPLISGSVAFRVMGATVRLRGDADAALEATLGSAVASVSLAADGGISGSVTLERLVTLARAGAGVVCTPVRIGSVSVPLSGQICNVPEPRFSFEGAGSVSEDQELVVDLGARALYQSLERVLPALAAVVAAKRAASPKTFTEVPQEAPKATVAAEIALTLSLNAARVLLPSVKRLTPVLRAERVQVRLADRGIRIGAALLTLGFARTEKVVAWLSRGASWAPSALDVSNMSRLSLQSPRDAFPAVSLGASLGGGDAGRPADAPLFAMPGAGPGRRASSARPARPVQPRTRDLWMLHVTGLRVDRSALNASVGMDTLALHVSVLQYIMLHLSIEPLLALGSLASFGGDTPNEKSSENLSVDVAVDTVNIQLVLPTETPTRLYGRQLTARYSSPDPASSPLSDSGSGPAGKDVDNDAENPKQDDGKEPENDTTGRKPPLRKAKNPNLTVSFAEGLYWNVFVPVNERETVERNFIAVEPANVSFAPARGDAPAQLDICAARWTFRIAHQFILSDLLDSVIAGLKALRQHHGHVPKPEPDNLTLDPAHGTAIRFAADEFAFEFEESLFEQRLSLIYELGAAERHARVQRQHEFVRFAGAGATGASGSTSSSSGLVHLYPEATAAKLDRVRMAALRFLEHYNAASWIHAVQTWYARHPCELADIPARIAEPVPRNRKQHLCRWLASNMVLAFRPVRLPTATVQQFVQTLDERQPSDYRYDDLFTFDMTLCMQDMEVRLRDYPLPLLHIDSRPLAAFSDDSERTTGLTVNVMFVVAEQLATVCSQRRLYIPVFDDEEPILVTRTINALKTFAECNVYIDAERDVQVTYGAAYDVAVEVVSQLIDTFNKPNVDPSPLLSSWDKLRFILHGRYHVNVGGGASVRAHLLGSRSPYFAQGTARDGNAGAVAVLGPGVAVHVYNDGRPDRRETVVLEASALRVDVLGARPLAAKEAQRDVTLLRLGGGDVDTVRLATRFEVDHGAGVVPRPHYEVVMRIPELAERPPGAAEYDAFAGFRSRAVTAHVQLACDAGTSAGGGGSFVNLNGNAVLVLLQALAIEQSSLSSVRINKGAVFETPDALPVPPKPRFSGQLRRIVLDVAISPLLVAFAQDTDTQTGTLSVRLRAQRISAHMCFEQHRVTYLAAAAAAAADDSAGGADDASIHSSASSLPPPGSPSSKGPASVKEATAWVMDAADVGVDEMEGRVCAAGDAIDQLGLRDVNAKTASTTAASFGDAALRQLLAGAGSLQEHDAAAGWLLTEDADMAAVSGADASEASAPAALYLHKVGFAPRISYFRRSLAATAREDAERLRAVEQDQRRVVSQRCDALEMAMTRYRELQAAVSFRRQVFDSVHWRVQTRLLANRLAALQRKRAALEPFRHCGGDSAPGSLGRGSVGRGSPAESSSRAPSAGVSRAHPTSDNARVNPTAETKLSHAMPAGRRAAFFSHNFVVHSLQLLYNHSVRNILLRLVALYTKSWSLHYFMGYAALNVFRELLEHATTDFGDGDDPLQRRGNGGGLGKGHGANLGRSRSQARDDADDGSSDAEADALRDLLDDLVGVDGRARVAHSERPRDKTGGTRRDGDEDAGDDERARSTLARSMYVGSRRPASPDHVPAHATTAANFVVHFLHPQVNLESHAKGNSDQLVAVLISAASTVLQSVELYDFDGRHEVLWSEVNEADLRERLIQGRMVVRLSDAQFLVARGSRSVQQSFLELADAAGGAPSSPSAPTATGNTSDDGSVLEPNFFDYTTLGLGAAAAAKSLPTEQTLQPNSKRPERAVWPLWLPLECFLDSSQPTGNLQRVVTHVSLAVWRDSPNRLYVHAGKTRDKTPASNLRVRFPAFSLEADSDQFYSIVDVIRNLLVYKDPSGAERNERLAATVFALEQGQRWDRITAAVVQLQQRIRQLQSQAATASAQTRARLLSYREDLALIMLGARQLARTRQARHSTAVAWHAHVDIGDLRWFLLKTGRELALATLRGAVFTMTHYEDQSSDIRFSVQRVNIRNLLQGAANAAYMDILAPFFQDEAEAALLQQGRAQMVAIYVRELPPVAGITVLDHVELNVFPVLLQLTNDVGRELNYYFFPDKPGAGTAAFAAATGTAAAPAGAAPAAVASAAAPASTSPISRYAARLLSPTGTSVVAADLLTGVGSSQTALEVAANAVVGAAPPPAVTPSAAAAALGRVASALRVLSLRASPSVDSLAAADAALVAATPPEQAAPSKRRSRGFRGLKQRSRSSLALAGPPDASTVARSTSGLFRRSRAPSVASSTYDEAASETVAAYSNYMHSTTSGWPQAPPRGAHASPESLPAAPSVAASDSDAPTPPRPRPESAPPLALEEAPSLDAINLLLAFDRQDQLSLMKERASLNRTYIYIKIPSTHLCLSYKGPKEKNFSDLDRFVFSLPTLEYRNKLWTTFELFETVRRDVTRVALLHLGSFVREKIFRGKKAAPQPFLPGAQLTDKLRRTIRSAPGPPSATSASPPATPSALNARSRSPSRSPSRASSPEPVLTSRVRAPSVSSAASASTEAERNAAAAGGREKKRTPSHFRRLFRGFSSKESLESVSPAVPPAPSPARSSVSQDDAAAAERQRKGRLLFGKSYSFTRDS